MFADFKGISGAKWAPGTLFKTLGEYIDLYFCLHKNEPVHHLSILENTGFIDQHRYPLDRIIKRYGSSYFTNTISYMIAYAMHKGYREIDLIGVDVQPFGEWAFERPSIAYWCGRAEGIGVKVNWPKIEPFFMYGFEEEEMKKVLAVLEEKKEIANRELDAATEQRIKDQWAGYKLAIDQVLREIRS